MAHEIGAPDVVFSRQKQFQAIHKLTHLKGPRDRVSSVIIPGILMATCFTLVVCHPHCLVCMQLRHPNRLRDLNLVPI
jgi:hypothetical protein